jgi:hypothetical protein
MNLGFFTPSARRASFRLHCGEGCPSAFSLAITASIAAWQASRHPYGISMTYVMRSGRNDCFKLRLAVAGVRSALAMVRAARCDTNFNAGDVSW